MSSTAFQAFSCEEFDTGKSFLRQDYAVQCYTPEHNVAVALALVGIGLYPVGLSVLYIVLFRKAHSAIVNETPTELSKALKFLIEDYEKAFYAWELFEAWKKLCLVGFAVLILPGTVLQLLIAFVLALSCMLATAVASPFTSVVDDYISKVCGAALVGTFFFAIIIKVNVLIEEVDNYMVAQLKEIFAFDIVVVSVGTVVAVTLALLFTAAMAIQQLASAVRAPVIKLRSTLAPPALPLDHGIIWHLFLSHVCKTAMFRSNGPCSSNTGLTTLCTLFPGALPRTFPGA